MADDLLAAKNVLGSRPLIDEHGRKDSFLVELEAAIAPADKEEPWAWAIEGPNRLTLWTKEKPIAGDLRKGEVTFPLYTRAAPGEKP
jgi:hypothetical protein